MHDALSQLIQTLNPQQASAVYPLSGTMLVCAGAGSGKTRIIIARIAYLLENGVPPESIVAVTFTNKAANEMKQRLRSVFPDLPHMPYIGTFHAFCLRTLKMYRHELGISDFLLLDEADQRKLVQDILKRAQLDKEYKARSVLGYISHRKNSSYTTDAAHMENATLEHIFHTYEQEKSAGHCYDFDDLLLHVVKHLQANTAFKARLHNTVHHILVDEYQDTNHIQHELLKELAQENGTTRATSICVVGDEDQSIYRWRGATVQNFVDFHHDFPETQRITITQNYRSAQPILSTANTVIQNNAQRYEKTLWSEKTGSDRILTIQCASHIQEAHAIAYAVRNVLDSGHQPAILYRSHYQSRAIEEALIRHNIAYTIVGGTEFYQRQEIKDILAYLKLVVNPYDHISWSRVCNTPSRGLGPKFQQEFLEQWRASAPIDCLLLSEQIQEHLAPAKSRSVKQFINIFSGLSPDQPAHEVCKAILERTHYITHLRSTHDEDEAREKEDNISELQRALSARPESSVQAFLEDITLMQQQHQEQDDQEHVLLMTLHAAKGLEFHTVIMSGLEEGIFPSNRARHDDDSLEEERRLLYVGLTRAQERVIMSYARYRATFGTLNDNPPSRFITELPERLVRHEQIQWWNDSDVHSYIQRWLSGSANNTKNTPRKRASESVQTDNNAQKQAHTATAYNSNWKRMQQVWHPQFGAGKVVHVTQKPSGQTYLTIQFQTTVKKLDAQYVSNTH